jgi:hypothetical protein
LTHAKTGLFEKSPFCAATDLEFAGIMSAKSSAKSINKVGGQITNTTTAPVTASPANDVEFCDSPGAFVRFGLRRSLLYDLYGQGLIKGVSLRRRGAARGKRLWSIDSIRSVSRVANEERRVSSPRTQKRAPAGVRDLMPAPIGKPRSTAEGGSKKGRFYKLLAKELRRGGFQYRQIARERNAAIYEQAWPGCAEPSPSYEVVRIRHREGFQIGNRFVRAAEIYPNSEAWGVDGFTFTNRNKAWDKFFEISLEEPARRGKEVNLKWENPSGSSSATPRI